MLAGLLNKFIKFIAWSILFGVAIAIFLLRPSPSILEFTYHGRILKPDNSPEIDTAVQFKLQNSHARHRKLFAVRRSY